MLNKFDRDFAIKELFQSFIPVMLNAYKPNLLGLIELENCFCHHGYIDNFNRKYTVGNLNRGYLVHLNYLKNFNFYLDLLIENGDQTIYPNKETFLDLLFINGSYDFLNFAKISHFRTNFIKDNNSNISNIVHFEVTDYKNFNLYNNYNNLYTRIKKGNTIRFFSKKLTSLEHFNDKSCYLTLNIDNVSDEEFHDLFKASNFDIYNPRKGDIAFDINDFIKELIKNGEEYTKLNPCDETNELQYDNGVAVEDSENNIYFYDENKNKIYSTFNLEDSEINFDDLTIGNKIYLMDSKYIIDDIIYENLTVTTVQLKSVKNES